MKKTVVCRNSAFSSICFHVAHYLRTLRRITLACLFMAVSLSVLGPHQGSRAFGAEPVSPPLVPVPYLTGLSEARAETVISDAGLARGNIDRQYRITVPTGVVIGQDPPVGQEVAQGSAIDLIVVKEPEGGTEIPSAWAGEWEITLTYLDAATDSITGVEIIGDAICPGDPLGLKLLDEVLEDKPIISLGENKGTVSDTHIQASFSGIFHASFPVPFPFKNPQIDLDFNAEFDMHLNSDDTLTGTFLWSADNVLCEVLGGFGQTVMISGIRLSPEPGGLCELPRSSFMQKFLRNPLLIDEEGAL